MPLLPQSLLSQTEEAEHFDGLSLLYWTIMGPHGINRAVQRMEFSDCRKGLGVKIIGGYREFTGEEYGIYIKRVLPGGVAALDGRLKSGDLLLDVNNMSLGGVTNERAVEILRMASASNHMSLLIVRDDESRKEFLELMEKYGSNSSTSPGRTSPTLLSTGKLTDTASSSSSSRSTSPQLLSPKETGTGYTGSCTTPATAAQPINDNTIQLICVAKGTGLGLVIKGGANRAEGPMVFIQEIVPGGDCQKDGRLKAGDQLISVNKESLIGVTYEEARSILTRTKLRPDPTVEIAFIRRRSSSGSSSGPQSPISLQPALNGNGQLLRPTGLSLLSPPATLVPKMSSTLNTGSETLPSVKLSQIRVVPVRTEQPPVASSESASAPDPSADPVSASQTANSSSTQRKVSLSSSSRLKLEKLEQALAYLGITPTEAQRNTLRERLRTDPAGTVAYGDFEAVTRELFKLQINESGLDQGVTRFASDDLTNLLEPTHVRVSTSDSDDLEEMERLRKDHIEALREIKKLQDQLAESESLHRQMQEELVKVKQEAKAAAEQSKALRTRIHLAEAAQKQARGMEMDYEEVIHLLEAEIADMKSQLVDQPPHTTEDAQDLKKRIAVLECQLRKSESAKKGFEVSTGKLLQFVEIVQDFLSENQASLRNYSSTSDPKTGSSQALAARFGRKTPWTASSLAVEAKELTRSVRAILEVDCLPYGWEEAYTADGTKYFINHVTQTTSWVHPVTSSLSLTEGVGDDQVRDPPEHRS
ncbi:syntaxin-binding protein 4 [Megalops cyprinoides]|uniref:syntaxin-binding protein 4 n=1 Tax=Megalops cyprinoides TaxID=118141 RepID=UPI001864D402|nr:syntaxin-binding protein 4 [Megalops cyprinoides]